MAVGGEFGMIARALDEQKCIDDNQSTASVDNCMQTTSQSHLSYTHIHGGRKIRVSRQLLSQVGTSIARSSVRCYQT